MTNQARHLGLALISFMLICTFSCSQKTGQADLIPLSGNAMPNGAWKRELDKDGKMITDMLVFVDGYYSLTTHESGSGAFISTKGGSFSKEGMLLKLNQEFHSVGPEALGTTEEWSLEGKGQSLSIKMGDEADVWQPVDVGQETPLTGAWLFAGRERNGEMQMRDDMDQPRKTMKMLTGSRFQWIAYNTATGEFFGTGGGEYSAEDGQYVEKIRFFSRNNDRVGAELPFQFSTEGGQWHHRGQSSSGDPMYEVWARRMK